MKAKNDLKQNKNNKPRDFLKQEAEAEGGIAGGDRTQMLTDMKRDALRS